ncbi:MAG: MBL fold metallo-hydrolase [Bacteroidales bacterium]|nr:MBL fold metallo-hydrolase [Bacteroidales bacterium]
MKRKVSLKELIDLQHYKIDEMTVKTFHFNPFQVNTYVLHDETKEAVIVDPGNYFDAENEKLLEYIETEELAVQYVVNTHPHIDHVAGNKWCVEHFHCPVYIHEQAMKIYHQTHIYCTVMGMEMEPCPEPDKFLQEGDTLTFGKQSLKVFYTPGHADGSICLYDESHKMVFVGDVLFAGSVGRTDLPTGSAPVLMQSIREKLMTLPDETTVFCGHEISTTIGYERLHNPFINNLS